MTVVDFFCGAGGFSEGFRQMGFEIVYGYDNWKPAVDTFNHNFNLECIPKNILDFGESLDEIEQVLNTDIIIGSPPCVSFSSSNKSGKADKSMGIKLMKTFLKIIAVKKHQPESTLKAWFMENVVNSKRFLQTIYTFKDLGLADWAKKHDLNPNKIAIDLNHNTVIINSADYGSFQSRKRAITGEIINKQKLIIPSFTHNERGNNGMKEYQTLRKLKEKFPNPFSKKSNRVISDPQYPIEISQALLTDHFYDSGIYKSEWEFSKYWKTNHPFMGKMSFPENEDKPSRTITATKIVNSRESIIYKSEIQRKGDGEYRLPTIREAAVIMGFPITYQFIGTEYTKWKLVGNAVCCSVSRALARTVLSELELPINKQMVCDKIPKLEGVLNLNSYLLNTFDTPPVKNKGARFRRHAIKNGNLTVTLSNYDIGVNSKKSEDKWFTSIQYGTGKGFPIQKVEDNYFKKIENQIKEFNGGKEFLQAINNGFSERIGNSIQLQELYELQRCNNHYCTPTRLVDQINEILEKSEISNELFKQTQKKIFTYKDEVPIKQICALYAVNLISSIANNK